MEAVPPERTASTNPTFRPTVCCVEQTQFPLEAVTAERCWTLGRREQKAAQAVAGFAKLTEFAELIVRH